MSGRESDGVCRHRTDASFISRARDGTWTLYLIGENEERVQKLPVEKKRARLTKKLFYDEFIVLGKNKTNGEVTPKAGLRGGADVTGNDVHRQANVVHVANDVGLTETYAKVFEVSAAIN